MTNASLRFRPRGVHAPNMALQRTRGLLVLKARRRAGCGPAIHGLPVRRSPLNAAALGGPCAWLLLGLFGGAALAGASEQPCSARQVKADVDRILTLKNLGDIYVEDAAADGTIAAEEFYGRPRRTLIPILRCSNTAPPVLIECLSDTRPTSARFKGGIHWSNPIRVPLGYVCLDLLLAMSTTESGSYDSETENDDGLGAGVKPSFYFRPDDYQMVNGVYKPRPVVLEVQAAWDAALRGGKLSFKYPVWFPGQE